jgi:hypothetical protein
MNEIYSGFVKSCDLNVSLEFILLILLNNKLCLLFICNILIVFAVAVFRIRVF